MKQKLWAFKLLAVLMLFFSLKGWGQVFISQYIDTNSGTTPKAIEIFNGTTSDIVFSASNNLQIWQGQNGAACAAVAGTNITSGTLKSGEVWIIGTADVISYATTNGTDLSGTTLFAFAFNGDDALQLKLGGVLLDVFGTCGNDPGSSWSGSGVSTADQNIQTLTSVTSGTTSNWTNPSLRFETVSTNNTLTGFGNAPYSLLPSCTAPTTQASAFTATPGDITTNMAQPSWTRGNGTAGVLVVAREGAAVNADPVSGTSYTANATFGSGSQIGTGNYVVYNGTGTNDIFSGLTPNTVYHFGLYEYNTTDTCYNTTELTGNLTTKSNAPTVAAANSVTSSGFTANWSAPSGQGSATYTYTLQYSTDNTFTTGVTETTGISSATLSQSISGLSASTNYYYRVKAVNAGGDSAWSSTQSATTNAAAPVIVLEGNATAIANGDTTPSTTDHTDFGSVAVGGSVIRTFTIKNIGNANLILDATPVTLLGSGSGFNVTQPANTTIAPNGSETFTVTFSENTAATYTQTVGIAHSSVQTFSYDVKGIILPPPPANDLCSGAISLLSGTPANGTVVNATESSALSEDNTEKDVWYKFTPSLNGNHTINLTATGTSSDYDIRVYSTACPSNGSSIFNAANSSMTDESLTANLTSGTEYFIRVIDYQGAGTTFSINVIAPLPADHLSFIGVPTTGATGFNIATFTVEARNSNNLLDASYAGNVTISKGSGSGNMTGTLTQAFVNGVATFNDIQFDAASTYTISAASGALTGATSGNIVVSDAVVYQKINSLAELTNGDYLIVDANDAVIAGNTITNGALVTSSVTPSSGQIINPNANNVWTINTSGGVSTIQNTLNSRYLNYASSTDLSLATNLSNSNQEWSISYQSTFFRISNVASPTRILKYNSALGTPGFKAYTLSTQSPEVSLYKKVAPTTTWSGSSWSNGDPTGTSNLNVVIQDPYSGASFTANNLTVNAPLTVGSGVNVTASGVVTNNSTITVADNGNFVQQLGSTYTGSGTFTLSKNSTSTTNIFDLWSSPVLSQGMDDIFVTDGSLVREYLTATDTYANVSPTAAFGKGYAVRGTGTDVVANFTGTPNNGTNTFTLNNTLSNPGNNRYNLVGNPYPSNFNLITFYNTNQGDGSTTGITPTMYFYNSSAATDKWGTFNATAGGTWARANAATTETSVKPGQAFFVSARSASTTVSFDNSMRNAAAAIFVNKAATSTTEGKYWLELTAPNNNTTGFAVTYGYGASNNFDLYDSKMMSTGTDAFYTYLGTEKLAIQGRDYFVSTDVVTLGNKNSAAGQYTISLVNKIGLFTAGQPIYLHDKALGTYTDLQTGNYSFTTNALEQQNRFEIVYQTSALGTAENVKAETKVYRDGEYFVVEASEKITGIEVYDASGRLVLTQQPNRMNARLLISSKGMYVIHIKTVKSETSKKVIK